MARRKRTSIFQDLVELASRLFCWVVLSWRLVSYPHPHTYAISPLPAVTDLYQMRQHLSSRMFRGTARLVNTVIAIELYFWVLSTSSLPINSRNAASAARYWGQIVDTTNWQ